MKFNAVFIISALLTATSQAMAFSMTGFVGADCTGSTTNTFTGSSAECVTAGSGSIKSFSFSGVPNQIQFFVSGGQHDNCSNGPQLTLGGGSGCATAPAGFNWESVFVS
ncbi:hypothetical protein BDN70DRAFT_901239 [Pholiota conissans]|uniref:Uncharacterized protein n=1 Tax=Pholiota conissans TaxID=109636 RepID=A0A9P6CTG9_9AGAR|nr:hypothetical protein BDN70DRAFT_901239 [Pholiota conissans]